jgi:uncharacterized membrane protein
MAAKKSKIAGAMLASAVALAFLTSPAHAGEASKAAAEGGEVKCVGGNACKGQGTCAGAGNACKAQNECKGKGFVMVSSEQECTDLGGKPEKAEHPTKM